MGIELALEWARFCVTNVFCKKAQLLTDLQRSHCSRQLCHLGAIDDATVPGDVNPRERCLPPLIELRAPAELHFVPTMLTAQRTRQLDVGNDALMDKQQVRVDLRFATFNCVANTPDSSLPSRRK